ncbi:MAG: BrnT family toxin [Gammaproteobacteria bacterium]|nr:BrnT family toxin [Gammaproteobacteria bacterium]MBT8444361.1 BrnT family toxin [Gammaproteobacteria bacterium]NND37847.1 BrnT family toxin [Gammaproteobacteria bacterium]
MLDLSFECFDWDAANIANCRRHGVALAEIEHALTHDAVVLVPDIKHSRDEERFIAVGKNANGRFLYVALTFRRIHGKRAVRPISARYMHRKEAERYEQARTKIRD